MRINCNISAVIANNQLKKGQDAVSKSIERLSSGLRINSAEDDAAGMAISKKMKTQIKALERASKNGSDGIYVVQTAEGALAEVEDMLQRARELAVQAANGTYCDEDREAIQNEVEQILIEIDRASNDTEYNTMPLLDGTIGRRSYANIDDAEMLNVASEVKTGKYTYDVTAPAKQPTATIKSFNGTADKSQEGVLYINGAEVHVEEGDSYDDVYLKIVKAADSAVVNLNNNGTSVDVTNKVYGSASELDIHFSGDGVASLFGMTKEGIKTYGTDCEVTLKDGFANTATYNSDGKYITVTDVNGFEMMMDIPGDKTFTDVTFEVTNIGLMSIQVGDLEGQQIDIDIPKVNTKTLGIDHIQCGTEVGARRAIASIDNAISKVSSYRSKLGAYQNRLETTVQSVDSYSENMTGALSGIEDCDMAEEMTNYTAQNVIAQAATSILAQANEQPQTILQLLQ